MPRPKLEEMARDADRAPAEVIEDAVIGLYDELAYTRELLNRRYDEMESGKVPGIDGEEAYRRLIEKNGSTATASAGMSGFTLHPEAFDDVEVHEYVVAHVPDSVPLCVSAVFRGRRWPSRNNAKLQKYAYRRD